MAQDDVQPVPAQQIIIQQPPTAFGRFGKWLLGALVVAVMMIISLYSSYHSYFSPADTPQEKYHSLAQFATKKIAIIDISGTIMEGEDSFCQEADRARRQGRRCRRRSCCASIRPAAPSPAATTFTITSASWSPRKKCRSSSAWAASVPAAATTSRWPSAARTNVIFAEPTTWTGSIGVIIPHFDVSGGLAKLGISEDSIASGPLKAMGSPTRPMTEAERKILQGLVDDSFKGFKEIVVSGRPKFKDDQAALDAVATGQIFTAQQALSKGLVDQIGFIEAAIARAAELAGESTDDRPLRKIRTSAIDPRRTHGANAQLSRARGNLDLSALIDLATPRAYYLWSWLPTAAFDLKVR